MNIYEEAVKEAQENPDLDILICTNLCDTAETAYRKVREHLNGISCAEKKLGLRHFIELENGSCIQVSALWSTDHFCGTESGLIYALGVWPSDILMELSYTCRRYDGKKARFVTASLDGERWYDGS